MLTGCAAAAENNVKTAEDQPERSDDGSDRQTVNPRLNASVWCFSRDGSLCPSHCLHLIVSFSLIITFSSASAHPLLCLPLIRKEVELMLNASRRHGF